MSRNWSEMGLQISDCLVLVVCVHFLLWNTLPKLSGSKQHVSNPSPQVGIWPWPSWMSGVRRGCHLTCWLSWRRVDLLSAQVCGRRQTPHGLLDRRPPLLPVGVHRELPTWQLPSSEGNREESQRRGRKREREGGRERGRERVNMEGRVGVGANLVCYNLIRSDIPSLCL